MAVQGVKSAALRRTWSESQSLLNGNDWNVSSFQKSKVVVLNDALRCASVADSRVLLYELSNSWEDNSQGRSRYQILASQFTTDGQNKWEGAHGSYTVVHGLHGGPCNVEPEMILDQFRANSKSRPKSVPSKTCCCRGYQVSQESSNRGGEILLRLRSLCHSEIQIKTQPPLYIKSMLNNSFQT